LMQVSFLYYIIDSFVFHLAMNSYAFFLGHFVLS